MGFPIRPSNVRVCQFRHPRTLGTNLIFGGRGPLAVGRRREIGSRRIGFGHRRRREGKMLGHGVPAAPRPHDGQKQGRNEKRHGEAGCDFANEHGAGWRRKQGVAAAPAENAGETPKKEGKQ